MQLTVSQVAQATGAGEHHVRQSLRSGDLNALTSVGRTTVFDDLAVQAWDRARARGRRWTDEVREAAFDMLAQGNTGRLSASERSRLRGRLRTMSPRQLAHASGGLGGTWARYRTAGQIGDAERVGPSGVASADLDMVGDSYLTFLRTDSLDDFELNNPVVLDASGNLGIVERGPDRRAIRLLLDTYLLGSARESAAAAERIEKLCHAL